ncbi:MAG: hypothetical protein GC206_12075 [Alphaproteobacteria bacterium]|nr:hypothetical protein [Alphaproteobacteria bacterium]
MKARVTALAALSIATGCVTAPNIDPPASAPSQWLGESAPRSGAAIDAWWRDGVSDPALIDLIDRAGAINSIAEAEARYLEARARVAAARGSLLPSITANGEASRTDLADAPAYDVEQASLGVGLDLDIFGASRNRLRAAGATANERDALLRLARIEARRTAADLYIALRSAQAQRAAAAAGEHAAAESFALSDSRYSAGLESGLSPAQARAARDAARARLPQFAQAETEARLALEALLGLEPGALSQALAAAQPIPDIRTDQMLSAPADVLAHHPDIAAAEARLARAGFTAAAARADLWPRVSLEAALLSVSAPSGFSGALSDGDQTQSAIALTAPLFNFGRLRALARAENYAAEAEAAQLRQAVLDRLADVETQRARLANARARVDAQAQARASARDAATLAQARYRSGLTSFLDVLTADRTLYDADAALAVAEAERAQAAIALAAALGLGQSPS